jgi:ATP-dependent Lhr-like helicase
MLSDIFSLFSKPLIKEVTRLDWKNLTEIQRLAIPIILKGENALVIAPTGTGKTEAVVFPLFEKFLQERSKGLIRGISILYITPLRALNRDILQRLIEVGDRLDIKVQVRHGDTVNKARRIQALNPPDMLITTPETLQAILPGKRMRQHLRSVRWIVVDEIHEIAADKRGVQLSLALERLKELSRRNFQRIGLSATIGSPELVLKYLVGVNNDGIVVEVDGAKYFEINVESPIVTSEDEKRSKELLISPGSISRIRRIFNIVQKNKTTLIFTNTREHAESLSSRMLALKPDMKIGVHHGSLSHEIRIETERGLKEGFLKAVICTSSLELGIDVGNIDFIIQYMSPKQVTRLLQRLGRSGHAIDETSRGCVIAAWPDDIIEAAVIARSALKESLGKPRFHVKALDVLAHQTVGLVLDWGRIKLFDAYEIIKGSSLYTNLDKDDFRAVVKQLFDGKKIWYDGDIIRKRSPGIFKYYYTNLSTITDVKHYDVVDYLRGKKVGTLDQEFVVKNSNIGQEFIMHGQTWKILSVDEDKNLVLVEPIHQIFGAVPSWEGEMIPVPFKIAQEVGRLRREIAEGIRAGKEAIDVLEDYPLDKESTDKIIDLIKKQISKRYPVATDKTFLIECFENYTIIHSCVGNLVNETLGKVLASLLSSRLGVNIGTQSDPYRIVLTTPITVNPDILREEIKNLRMEDIKLILETTLPRTSLFTWRLWNVAKRFGIVEKEAEYNSYQSNTLRKTLFDTPIFQETLREIFTEKMDLEKSKKIISMIQREEIKVIVTYNPKEYSPLALPILDRIAPQDILRPAVPTEAIIEIIKERLNSNELRLICILNADYNAVRKVRSLSNRIRCPSCGSTLLTATHPYDTDTSTLVMKKRSKKTMSREDKKRWLRILKNANLIQTYGKKAALTLSAKGVGPTNAVRILRRYHKTEKEFYLDIIRAEREYVRTRAFWIDS